ASSCRAANVVDHALEMVEVADAQTQKRIGIAGDREAPTISGMSEKALSDLVFRALQARWACLRATSGSSRSSSHQTGRHRSSRSATVIHTPSASSQRPV